MQHERRADPLRRMNLRWLMAVALVLLVLDLLALDDITTGNEPDFMLEYLCLGVSVAPFGLLGWALLQRRG